MAAATTAAEQSATPNSPGVAVVLAARDDLLDVELHRRYPHLARARPAARVSAAALASGAAAGGRADLGRRTGITDRRVGLPGAG